MIIKNGTLFCENGSFRTMDLKIQNGHIAEIGSQLAADGQESLDATNCYVVPGLVDIHIHGAVGADFSDGEGASIQTMARFLLSQGVTSFLGTSMALPGEPVSNLPHRPSLRGASGSRNGYPPGREHGGAVF